MAFVPLGPGWKPRNKCQQDFNVSFSLHEGWISMKSFKFVAMELPSKDFIYFSVLREREYKLTRLLCGYRRIGFWSFGIQFLQDTGTLSRCMMGLNPLFLEKRGHLTACATLLYREHALWERSIVDIERKLIDLDFLSNIIYKSISKYFI